MSATNAETVAKLVAFVRDLPEQQPADHRAALLATDSAGGTILDRIRTQRASGHAAVSGTPWAPAQLLNARHNRPSPTTSETQAHCHCLSLSSLAPRD